MTSRVKMLVKTVTDPWKEESHIVVNQMTGPHLTVFACTRHMAYPLKNRSRPVKHDRSDNSPQNSPHLERLGKPAMLKVGYPSTSKPSCQDTIKTGGAKALAMLLF